MKTVSLVGSVSRLAGGLFESVRRLHQEILGSNAKAGEVGRETGSASERVQVRVLGMRDGMTEADNGAWAPVPVESLRALGPKQFGYMPGLGVSLRQSAPDLVHLHGLWQYPSVAVTQWHRRTGRPYLVSPHGMLDAWALRNSGWKKRLAWAGFECATLRGATCIRALCASEGQAVRDLGLPNPIAIIPNGVDLPSPNESAVLESCQKAVSPLAAGRRVLLYLGRIHLKKGLVPLVKAWTESNPPEEWLLVIAGWDQERHETALKALATSLGVPWSTTPESVDGRIRIVFAGPQFGPAKRRWLQRCDAFVLPSFSEGLPMAVLEAWAYAKPALITPQCNLSAGYEVGAGIRIEPTLAGIRRGLAELFGAPRQRLQWAGARGHTLVARKFTWSAAAAEMKRVYYWLAGSGEKPDSVTCS